MNTLALIGSIINGKARFAGTVDPNLVIGSVIRQSDNAREVLKHNGDPIIRGTVEGTEYIRDALLRLFQNAAVCANCGAQWDSSTNQCIKGCENEKPDTIRENREPACCD